MNYSPKKAIVMRFKKGWINAMIIIFMAGILLLLIVANKNISTNQARIETLLSHLKEGQGLDASERDAIIIELQEQKFKQDYYVNQLGIQSDWLILYVSILFVILGFGGFGVFNTQISELRKEVDDLKTENSDSLKKLITGIEKSEDDARLKFEKLEQELENRSLQLKSDNYNTLSMILERFAANAEIEGDYYNSFAYYILTVWYGVKSFKLTKDGNIKTASSSWIIDKFEKSKKILLRFEDYRNRNDKRFETHFLNSVKYDVIIANLNEIQDIDEIQIRELALEVKLKLKDLCKDKFEPKDR